MAGLPEGPYRRHSARVLLVDDEDRLLLFGFHNRHRPGGARTWITPGGGIDEGETVEAAAARELFEETGLRVAPEELGRLVGSAAGYAELSWAKGVFRDDYFFHRTTAYDVDTSGFEEVEQSLIDTHRWWTLDELAATSERIVPFGLVPLLTDLLAGRVPAEPVRLPWHH